ncbi:hypothetical protein DPMN_114595 [Dreissena polymorpha]|uniref:Uncharacterized protein n=1 Tax=Dreissena polymorpha TaxID=45954 RepID=A0A9D4KKW6_DREPO|nr:hypothetical protein DPMN_114595 [Dreissena polymorpha]
MRFEDHGFDVCLSCLMHIPKLLLLSPLFDVLPLDTVPVLALPSAKLPVSVHASLQILGLRWCWTRISISGYGWPYFYPYYWV